VTSPRDQVRDITVAKRSNVTIEFCDGHTHTFTLDELRTNCPCAGCRSVRDRGEVPWPTATSTPEDLTVVDAQLIGAWGLGITWNDGHATGIFPWEALRRWSDTGNTLLPPDSGLGG
jgi:DUF971 family protein